MADYISQYTGGQIDSAVGRALPGGALEALIADKLPLSGGTISAPSTAPLEIYGDHSDGSTTIQYANKTGLKGRIGFNASGKPIITDANGDAHYILHAGNIGSALIVNGVTEWINPPMQLGVEYRTTERYLGKPVYTKLLDGGAAPNNGTKDVVIGASNIDHVFVDLSKSEIHASGPTNLLPTFADIGGFFIFNGEVRVHTVADRSAYTMKICVKYTKTTD